MKRFSFSQNGRMLLAVLFAVAVLAPSAVFSAPVYRVETQIDALSGGTYQYDSDWQEDSSPVSAVSSNNLENPKARGFGSAAADPGSVAVISNTKASGIAPAGQDTTSTANVYARFTLTDLIFSGPAATVTTSLNLAWSGFMSGSVESLNADSWTDSNTIFNINGSIFRPASTTFLSFSGNRTVSKWQDGLSPQETAVSDSGILAGAYPPSGLLVTNQFTVPTGEPLSIKLGMAAFSGTILMSLSPPSASEGSAVSMADFGSTLSFPLYVPVFNLDAGFSVGSAEGSIYANQWTGTPVSAASIPEPSTLLLLGSGLVGLLGVGFRRRKG